METGKIVTGLVEKLAALSRTSTSPPAGADETWTCPHCGQVHGPARVGEALIPARAHHQMLVPGNGVGCDLCAARAATQIVQAQILADAMQRFGLSEYSYRAMTLASYQPATVEQQAALAAANGLLDRWRTSGLRGKVSLILWSPVNPALPARVDPERQGYGVGKTHLAVALLQEAAALGYSVALEKMPNLIEEIQGTYQDGYRGPGERQILDRVRDSQVALLDDVGTEQVKALGWYQAIIYRLLDHAYMKGHALLITTNLPSDRLAQHVGERAASRLVGLCLAPIKLVGPDGRQRKE